MGINTPDCQRWNDELQNALDHTGDQSHVTGHNVYSPKDMSFSKAYDDLKAGRITSNQLKDRYIDYYTNYAIDTL